MSAAALDLIIMSAMTSFIIALKNIVLTKRVGFFN